MLKQAVKKAKPRKATRKTGKEKANDVPRFVRGERRRPDESLGKAIDRVMRKGGYKPPYKTGPTSDYNKVKKYLSRN